MLLKVLLAVIAVANKCLFLRQSLLNFKKIMLENYLQNHQKSVNQVTVFKHNLLENMYESIEVLFCSIRWLKGLNYAIFGREDICDESEINSICRCYDAFPYHERKSTNILLKINLN